MLILAQFFLVSPTCFLLILKYFVLDQLLEKYSNLPPGKIKKQKWSEKKKIEPYPSELEIICPKILD